MSDFDYESRYRRALPTYPEKGVILRTITPLFADPEGLVHLVDDIADHFLGPLASPRSLAPRPDGFLVGAPVAYKLGAGFVPARKPGKLPREVYSQSYSLEYGIDELQIHKDALKPDDVVLIVDDLVATGGTAAATAKLVEQSGARIEGFSFILELTFLNPRDVIAKEYPDCEVYTLIPVK